MQTIQQSLSQCYSRPQVIQLIKKQIDDLEFETTVKCMRKFMVLSFSVPTKSENYCFHVENKSIEWMIVLGKGFPFNAPRLHIKTKITAISFDDCRDLLSDVLNIQEWSPHITLKQIQLKVIPFLSSIKQDLNIYKVARIGQFQMNSVYPIDLIKQLRDGEVCYSFEYNHDNVLKMCIIDISATHIVIFHTKQQPEMVSGNLKIPSQKEITSCMIVFYAELGTIAEILVNRANFNDLDVKFVSRKPQNMQMMVTSVTKKLKIRKGSSLIQKLIKSMKNYGTLDTKIEMSQENVAGEEKEKLERIEKSEKQLEHKFNSKTVKEVNESYQDIIEYYSSNNIPYFQIYIQKIVKLYQRPDVQLIMSNDNIQNQAQKKNRKFSTLTNNSVEKEDEESDQIEMKERYTS